MYLVSTQLYQEAAERLKESIGCQDYFSGSVNFEFAGIACRLVVSVIVYRRRVAQPEVHDDPISDLVPVWWEFHTDAGEGEVLNDFSFAELRTIV